MTVQLLWERMCRGSGHARLRFTLCEVWRCCFGQSSPPACLEIRTPQRISHEQTHPAYTPAYRVQEGEELAKAKTAAEEKAKMKQQQMKLTLGISKGGATVHSRHIQPARPGGALQQPALGAQFFEWRVSGARDPRVWDVEQWVEHHRKGVERSLRYTNQITKSAPPPAAPLPPATQAPAPPPPATQAPALMIKLPGRP